MQPKKISRLGSLGSKPWAHFSKPRLDTCKAVYHPYSYKFVRSNAFNERAWRSVLLMLRNAESSTTLEKLGRD